MRRWILARSVFRAHALVLSVSLFLAGGILSVASAAYGGDRVASTADIRAPAASTDVSGYQLGTGDQLKITVFGETDLSGNYTVDNSGYLHLPLVGQVKATGRTLPQLEDLIQAKLAAGYIVNPRVSAEVTNYRPFYIIGEVNKPGEYSYVGGMNVLTAVALAGGYTYRADDSSVYIRHKGGKGEVSEPADQSTKIEPGDIIRVAERFF
ncbi:MAG: polysaccharide export protein [Alphaproteobacteria bacterium]|nr:polysaccharide export protein [Alphaproteobacteria bacterium]MDE2496163.1 polysaccharide export protein [Alphaproteobacteria bacterium]